MRIVVIGGSGHIGTYLVPGLVEAGHHVIHLSRGRRQPYQQHPAWSDVESLPADREAEDHQGTFGRRVAALKADAVIDLICFLPSSARLLVDSLAGRTGHLLHCGTIWVHGPSVEVPTTESAPRHPFGEYGIRKAEIEALLLRAAREHAFPASVLHPGHIVGHGWAPVNPAGNFNPDVFATLAQGRTLALPNLGMETLHHVHAADVARAFLAALDHPAQAIGEAFHVVSPAALTLRGYAEAMAAWFGRPAVLRFLPWPEWKQTATPEDADATWDHLAHSPNCSGAKAQRLLRYRPKFRSLEAIQESVRWLIEHGKLTTAAN